MVQVAAEEAQKEMQSLRTEAAQVCSEKGCRFQFSLFALCEVPVLRAQVIDIQAGHGSQQKLNEALPLTQWPEAAAAQQQQEMVQLTEKAL